MVIGVYGDFGNWYFSSWTILVVVIFGDLGEWWLVIEVW